ncbi:hypothetical protein DYB32_002693 [Aphanomyces invadans]|uniref:Transmembrane protein n=1 Tax=Aphanomyces invadans TaxID=157072 RepID=A0A418B2T4_9STRA|nr:hypothetical protein DYB32_002693 [Aphanomyces invadans]
MPPPLDGSSVMENAQVVTAAHTSSASPPESAKVNIKGIKVITSSVSAYGSADVATCTGTGATPTTSGRREDELLPKSIEVDERYLVDGRANNAKSNDDSMLYELDAFEALLGDIHLSSHPVTDSIQADDTLVLPLGDPASIAHDEDSSSTLPSSPPDVRAEVVGDDAGKGDDDVAQDSIGRRSTEHVSQAHDLVQDAATVPISGHAAAASQERDGSSNTELGAADDDVVVMSVDKEVLHVDDESPTILPPGNPRATETRPMHHDLPQHTLHYQTHGASVQHDVPRAHGIAARHRDLDTPPSPPSRWPVAPDARRDRDTADFIDDSTQSSSRTMSRHMEAAFSQLHVHGTRLYASARSSYARVHALSAATVDKFSVWLDMALSNAHDVVLGGIDRVEAAHAWWRHDVLASSQDLQLVVRNVWGVMLLALVGATYGMLYVALSHAPRVGLDLWRTLDDSTKDKARGAVLVAIGASLVLLKTMWWYWATLVAVASFYYWSGNATRRHVDPPPTASQKRPSL